MLSLFDCFVIATPVAAHILLNRIKFENLNAMLLNHFIFSEVISKYTLKNKMTP